MTMTGSAQETPKIFEFHQTSLEAGRD